jgi:soluble lytic murein transglycosylase-like protein
MSDNFKAFFRSFCFTAATLSVSLVAYEHYTLHGLKERDLTVEEAVDSLQNSVKYDLEPFAFDALLRDTHYLRQQVNFISNEIERHSRSTKNTKSLASLIVTESLRAQVDPLFVASIIRSESSFKNHAISHRGAQGLMQITPNTGAYISQQRNIPWRGTSSLLDPSTNLRLGIEYLKYLDLKFSGNREKVLIAYNWGPGNLQDAVRYRRRVPGESVQYARTILSTHKKWKSSIIEYAANLPAQTRPSLG